MTNTSLPVNTFVLMPVLSFVSVSPHSRPGDSIDVCLITLAVLLHRL